MSRIVHFELPADNPERAMNFYQKAFGWSFQKFEGPSAYWLIKTGEDGEPGINGGLLPRQHDGHVPVSVVGVANIDDAVKAIESAGGTMVVPKMAIPTVGYAAYFTDPEGHTMGVFQDDPSAS